MTPVSETMRERIEAALAEIERQEEARILIAVESGSRAWGFHSDDSDYDVRFIYAKPEKWHYRLGKKRDVIERPINSELDLSGWELSKALELMLGSNAVVAEWLQSPIRYLDVPEAFLALSDLAERALNRTSVTWHYLSLARQQRGRLVDPEGQIRIKRYFYVLRPVLALRWMRLNGKPMPPMDMGLLRSGTDLSPQESDHLDALTWQKMNAAEQAFAEATDPVLDELISDEIALAEEWVRGAQKAAPSTLWEEASALHMSLSQL